MPRRLDQDMSEERRLFKDYLSMPMVEMIAERWAKVHDAFDAPAFIAQIADGLDEMELKQRSAHIAYAIDTHFADYRTAIEVILKTADWDADVLKETEGFLYMPMVHYIEAYGLDKANYELSMQANYEMTKRWTAEFSIRPYITKYPERTWDYLLKWRDDENEHPRRLVSEGTRPRLPWASQLPQFIADPTPLFELLTPMMDDESEYVRRSVANNLNDITKDHPERVIEFLQDYQNSDSKGTQWIIKHALRSLIKAGNPNALAILGYGEAQVQIDDFTLSPTQMNMGDSLDFSFTLTNTGDDANLMIDYVIHFMKANGKTRPKVFKLTQRKLASGDSETISRSHTIRPITTRKYYTGDHRLEIQVNGRIIAGLDFHLSV